MLFIAKNYSKVTLAFLSVLGSGIALASQPNDTAYSQASPHNFFSSFPASLNLKHGHAVIQLGGYWLTDPLKFPY